jgi:hypothetical protein
MHTNDILFIFSSYISVPQISTFRLLHYYFSIRYFLFCPSLFSCHNFFCIYIYDILYIVENNVLLFSTWIQISLISSQWSRGTRSGVSSTFWELSSWVRMSVYGLCLRLLCLLLCSLVRRIATGRTLNQGFPSVLRNVRSFERKFCIIASQKSNP